MVRSVGKSGVFKSAPTGVILGWDVQSNAVNNMHTPNRDFWPFRLHKTQKGVLNTPLSGGELMFLWDGNSDVVDKMRA